MALTNDIPTLASRLSGLSIANAARRGLQAASDDDCQSVDQQLRIPSFRYKIGTTEREKKRYAAP